MTQQRPDEATLEQVRTQLETNLYVEAGAGTGKTNALVTRLTELLTTGTASTESIAAITFTRAAAFEMRSRLRASLEERHGIESEPVKKAHIATALDGLDSLAIQTIHSFALSMLREQPLDVGLPPVVDPLDDIQAAVEFDESWNDWFTERIESNEELVHSLRIAGRIGLRSPADKLKDLAKELGERHQLLKPGMFDYSGPEPPTVAVSRLAETLVEARRIAASGPGPDDGLCRFMEAVVAPELESLLALAGDATELPASDFVDIARFRPNRNQQGAKAKWNKSPGGEDAMEQLRALLDSLEDEVEAARNILRQQVVAVLVSTAAEFALSYAVERRANGRPTFHDQLVFGRELLQDHKGALARFRERFRFILVDEFQDTDPVQIDLLRLLAGTEVTSTNNAKSNSDAIRPGRLFVVGDPKQSIYRFRGADPASASAFSDEVATSGQRLPLSENHRSLPGVLKWVNAVFGGWMVEARSYGQAPYYDLDWDHALEAIEAELQGPPVWWFGGERDVDANATRRLEFEEIAAISEAAGSGAFPVRDSDNKWRDSQFSDVAVLVKTRGNIDMLEDALVSRNVPYVFDSQSPLFTSQDVRDLHSCLTAIDDPSDQVAVLAALRSPAFSCPDTDLLRWRNARGRFTYIADSQPDAPGSVANAFAVLNRFHTMSRERDTASLIEYFIRDRRLREKATLARSGPERVRRLDMVVELAGALADPQDSGSRVTLRDFTRWLERQSDENARMPERISQGEAADAVRIMTIHGSKGLEFPIVVMASAMPASSGRDSVQVRTLKSDDRQEQVEVQFGNKDFNLKTTGAEMAMEQEKSDSELEDVRLLYVAATRACDHLLVSRYRGKSGSSALVNHIERHLDGNEHLWRQWEMPAQTVRLEPSSAGPVATRAERDRWLVERQTLVAEASRSRYTTPTALKSDRATKEPLQKEPSERLDDEPGRRGRGATELGRAVHGVLQLIDLTGWTEDSLASLSRRMAEEHGVAARLDQVIAFARNSLHSHVMQRAAEAAKRGDAWREVSVAAPLEGGELEGQIDLLFREEDGSLTVVDHKTDRVYEGDLAAAAEPYLFQMAAYAWCTEKVTGLSVTRAILLFAREAESSGSGEYEVPDLESLKQKVVQTATSNILAPVGAD